MTKDDTIKVLALLKAAYPASYKDMTKQEAYGTIGVWAMQFSTVPVDIVMMAVQKLIAKSKFPPTIAEVKGTLESIHWEAYSALTSTATEFLTEEARAQYKKIMEATDSYKYGKYYEPSLAQMIGGGALRLGTGE